MADGNRTTITVALAGIAATAIVGLAGTTASWLNARDDRDAQRALARDERTYQPRVSAYLDSIDFLKSQQAALDGFAHLEPPRQDVPYPFVPPRRLVTRLRAFGSRDVFLAFTRAEAILTKMPVEINGDLPEGSPGDYLNVLFTVNEPIPPMPEGTRLYIDAENDETKVNAKYWEALDKFEGAVAQFEELVHNELGF